jgi:DoxX-like family
MTTKTKNIINWVLTGLVGLIFIGSAFGKLTGAADALKMAESIGIDPYTFTIIGVVELISALLFIIPRTGDLGTLLLVAYMGGVIATHVEHGLPVIAPVIIAAFVWIVAALRFPELTQRFFGKSQ